MVNRLSLIALICLGIVGCVGIYQSNQADDTGPFSRNRVLAFIDSYFNAANRSDVEALVAHYAAQVDYYSWGPVERELVYRDKLDYHTRWPQVSYTLVNMNTLEITESDQPNERLVNYELAFSVHNPAKAESPDTISGVAFHTWQLRADSDGLKIVRETQQVLERNTHAENE